MCKFYNAYVISRWCRPTGKTLIRASKKCNSYNHPQHLYPCNTGMLNVLPSPCNDFFSYIYSQNACSVIIISPPHLPQKQNKTKRKLKRKMDCFLCLIACIRDTHVIKTFILLIIYVNE